ncbi:hypothetical protein [Spirosoma rigui]|uniref:hypothetical protein n=1 Tax=Spirosoma rigui TaxID=564064 RepID=UPI0009AF85B4|nr:hypothetical protein [Spirosoma rigui]
MKFIKSIAVGLCLVTALNACTPKMTFTASTIVPAANGTVSVKTDKNKNYILDVTMQNLAPAKNLTPSRNTYLVWMETKDNSVKKLGQISPSGKALRASLSATSIDKPDQVFVTAEDNADISFPSGDVILTTRK